MPRNTPKRLPKDKRPSRLPPLWDRGLRGWSVIYFTVLVVDTAKDLIGAFAQGGLDAAVHDFQTYLDRYSYLVQLARAYPTLFWTAFGVATVAALAGVALWLLDLAGHIQAWLAARREDERREYLEAVDAKYKVVPLVIDLDNETPLDEIVYQKLKYQADSTGAPGAVPAAPQKSPEEAPPVDDMAKVLETTRSALILGGPGDGKTTMLRHAVSQFARSAHEDLSAFLPVYLSLPLFAPFLRPRRDGPPPEFPVTAYLLAHERALDALGSVATRESFATRLETSVQHGEALLFLDGLDEVDSGDRPRLEAWIAQRQRVVQRHGALIVATRYTDYARGSFTRWQPGPGRDYARFSEWIALPMDLDAPRKLATPLVQELYKQLQEKYSWKIKTSAQPDPDAFVEQIEKHTQAQLWGTNPLLFSLAAAVYVENVAQGSGELPASRVTLYGQFISALLAKIVRARQQTVATGARETGLRREMLRVLAEFALWLTRQRSQPAATIPPGHSRPAQATQAAETAAEGANGKSFTEQVLDAATVSVRSALSPAECDPNVTASVMASWVVQSGTLNNSPAKGPYEFRHPTYQEYLTALALAERLAGPNEALERDAWDIVKKYRFEPAWTEAMRMLAGALLGESALRWLNAPQVAREWMGQLRAYWDQDAAANGAANETADHADAALVLAVASLAEIPGVDSFGGEIDAPGILRAWAEALLRTAREGHTETLGDLQRLTPSVAVLPPAFKQPALDQLHGALSDESQPERQVAAADALSGMGELADVAALDRLLRDSQNEDARIAAARALAKLETSDRRYPGYAALQASLTGDDLALARIAAGALVEAGSVAYPLMLVAIASADAEVRRLGTVALGGVGARAQGTLQRLTTRDPDPAVALTAAEMLRRLGEDFDALLPALTRVARQGAGVASAALDRALQDFLPQALRQLGFVGRLVEGVALIVPPTCDVPAGTFLMGSDPKRDRQAYDDEEPLRSVTLPGFQIGQYPVTVAEYACFVRAGHAAPRDWERQLQRLDHPVVSISWHDAVAYARWLAQLTGEEWWLPSETEWEKAARGTDGHIYPWGDQWDNTRANAIEGGPRSTSPVGLYADRGDASPYGAHDMAGNVWEWTANLYERYTYASDGTRANVSLSGYTVLRGGSWRDSPGYARTAYRNPDRPDLAFDNNGFRLVRAVRNS